jgi:hypothetical protein
MTVVLGVSPREQLCITRDTYNSYSSSSNPEEGKESAQQWTPVRKERETIPDSVGSVVLPSRRVPPGGKL